MQYSSETRNDSPRFLSRIFGRSRTSYGTPFGIRRHLDSVFPLQLANIPQVNSTRCIKPELPNKSQTRNAGEEEVMDSSTPDEQELPLHLRRATADLDWKTRFRIIA